jgi:2'-5' RNA ligase
MAQIRTFICFELPGFIKTELQRVQNALKPISKSVRWSHVDGIHLTLKFLGDVDEEILDDIHNAVKKAAEKSEPFQIDISGVGAFPNFNRPNVYWIGVKESSGALLSIQQKIENELEQIGFAKERRPFSPHLTIGRVKSQEGLKEISKTLQNAKLPSMTFVAAEILVMKSVLQPGGARYTPLSVIKL